MIQKKKTEKTEIKVKKPETIKHEDKKEMEDQPDLPLAPEDVPDIIPEEDLFETPPYEPPASGEGP